MRPIRTRKPILLSHFRERVTLGAMSKPVVSSAPDIMGGTPVFPGTRVPVQTLLDYIEAGDTIDERAASLAVHKAA